MRVLQVPIVFDAIAVADQMLSQLLARYKVLRIYVADIYLGSRFDPNRRLLGLGLRFVAKNLVLVLVCQGQSFGYLILLAGLVDVGGD